MKNIYFFFSLQFFCCFLLFSTNCLAQISGNVYLDVNNNGVKTIPGSTQNEVGVFGVTVKAYNSTNTLVQSITTNSNGDYSLPLAVSFPIRLEFISPKNFFPAKRNNAKASNVQFIKAATSNANYGIGYHSHYATNSNPYIVTNAMSNGNALSSGVNDAGTRQNLMITPYALDNTWKTGTNYQNQWLGSVFGITHQKETKTILLAAYLKRHASFGPGGIDAIYKTTLNASGDATQPTVLFKLSTLGINVGADPRSVALPNDHTVPNTDLGVFGNIGKLGIGNIDLAENGKDLYVTNLFENKIHRINIGMPIKNTFYNTDVTGTWNIPGPALAGADWHLMSVKYYEGLVYVGGITSKQRTDAPIASAADLASDHVNLNAFVYALNPETGSITEVLQVPLNYRRGQVIDQYRYEYKTNWWRAWQNNGDADVIRNDFNDAYEIFPQPSAPYNTGNNTGMIYPQPMLSDIEFDVNGSMIIALRDRFGDQSGLNNFLEGANGSSATSGGTYFRGFASGEILKAGRNGNVWTIENNAAIINNGVELNSNPGNIQGTPPANASNKTGSFTGMTGSPWGWSNTPNEGFGPGGRYFYYNHSYTSSGVPISNLQSGAFSGSSVHYTKSLGGISILPGYDEVVQTSLSPLGRTFTSGLLKMSNSGLTLGCNAGNMTDQQELVPGIASSAPSITGLPSGFGKANGLGDVEVLNEAMPIEIGNRVWNDANANGIQDPDENGIGNVTILLRSPGIDGIYGNADDQTWSTVSSTTVGDEGDYYFDNSLINDNRKVMLGYTGLPVQSGVLNGQTYRIEIDPIQTGLSGLTTSTTNVGAGANEHIDNDGSTQLLSGIGLRAFANVNTANNNYNYDFGFKLSALPIHSISLNTHLNNDQIQLNWKTVDENETAQFNIEQSTDLNSNFVHIDQKNASGTTFGEKNYSYNYLLTNTTATTIYNRIKLIFRNGATTYSNVTMIKPKSNTIKIWPNPFVENIQLLINSSSNQKISVVLNDLIGKNIITINKNIIIGSNAISLEMPGNISPGIYLIKIYSASGTLLQQEKIIKK